jgi:hypothetical protein
MSATRLLTEQLLSLSQAARRIPPYRGGRTNPSTNYRWLTSGVKLPDGTILKLEGIRLAGRWVTSSEAVDRFLTAQNTVCNPNGDAPTRPAVRTSCQRQRASERASRALDEMGF